MTLQIGNIQRTITIALFKRKHKKVKNSNVCSRCNCLNNKIYSIIVVRYRFLEGLLQNLQSQYLNFCSNTNPFDISSLYTYIPLNFIERLIHQKLKRGYKFFRLYEKSEIFEEPH